MANIKISELEELNKSNDEDLLVIVDSVENMTKKIKAKNLGVGGGSVPTGDTLPIGAIIPFGGTEAPTGWLICDGAMLNRETYKELFAAIGTNFGTDGPGNFYIPDLRGKVAVGQDTTDSDFGMGAVGGSKYIQDHHHEGIKWAEPNGQNINMNTGTGGVQIEPNSWQGGDGTNSPIYSGKVYGTPTGNSGNLQPYQVTNYIIKAFQSAGVVAQVSNTKSNSTTDTYSCDYINKRGTINQIIIDKYSTSWWQASSKISEGAKYIVIDMRSDEETDNVTVMIPVEILKKYSTYEKPYFIKNNSGLIFQCIISPDNTFQGLNRAEAGSKYVANVYEVF